MDYRLYLLGEDKKIRAAESFCIDDDVEAVWVDNAVYSACRDQFYGYAMWNAARLGPA